MPIYDVRFHVVTPVKVRVSALNLSRAVEEIRSGVNQTELIANHADLRNWHIDDLSFYGEEAEDQDSTPDYTVDEDEEE